MFYRNGLAHETCLRMSPLKWDISQPSKMCTARGTRLISIVSQPIKAVVVCVVDDVTVFVYPRNLLLEFGQNRVRYLCWCFCFLCVDFFCWWWICCSYLLSEAYLSCLVQIGSLIDEILLFLLLLFLLIPDTYLWSLAKIGLVATEILLTFSLWWWWLVEGGGGCAKSF